jgi:hypothetical protein
MKTKSFSSKRTIRIEDKVFAKTLRFGNQKVLTIFRNKKKYNRKAYSILEDLD